MFPDDCFSVAGELEVGGHKTERRKHYFCSSCKNFVFSRIEGADNRVNLRTSVLDDPNWFAPFVEIMTDEKLEWSCVSATHSLPQFPQNAEELKALMDDYAER